MPRKKKRPHQIAVAQVVPPPTPNAPRELDVTLLPTVHSERASSERASDDPTVNALLQMAAAVQTLANGVDQLVTRVDGLEQRMIEGEELRTLATNSGLSTIGLSGGPNDQGQLANSGDYRLLERQLLNSMAGDEVRGNEHTVVIGGTAAEEEGRRTRLHSMLEQENRFKY